MKENQDTKLDPLEHIDSRRRSFLAKMIAGGVALPAMTTLALGQEEDGDDAAPAGKGKGGGKGKGNREGRGKGKGRGDAGGGADHAKTAKDLIAKFDKDGDNALNAEELTAAVKSLEGGGAGGMADGGSDAGKGKGKGDRGAGKGKGKGRGDSSDDPGGGGVVPKRPESE